MRGPGNSCEVTNAGMRCYCDQGCHGRGDCCSDIETIGCYGMQHVNLTAYHLMLVYLSANNSCLNNTLNTSCCDRSNDIACRVTLSSGTSCWCDSRCKMSNNDCCNDFMQFCPSSTPTSSTGAFLSCLVVFFCSYFCCYFKLIVWICHSSANL